MTAVAYTQGRRVSSLVSIQRAMTDLRADYNAAKSSRFRRRRTGLPSMGSGADYHIRSDSEYLKIIENARDFDRNDVVVGQAVTRLVDNLLQTGFRLDIDTGNDALDDALTDRWNAWASNPSECDAAREHTFASLTNIAVRAMIVDGDHVGLGTRPGSLQLVESHRVRTPTNTKQNVVLGVLLNDLREHLQYWVTRDDIDPMAAVRKVGDVVQYPVRDENGLRVLFHLYDPRRVSQTRGVSALAPVFDAAGMHDDIQFSQLVKQQVSACFAFIEKQTDAAVGAGGAGATPILGSRTTETRSDGTEATIESIGPGMRVRVPRGVDVQMESPSIPNAEFFTHTTLILQFIAINLNLPVQVLLLDPSKSNFSGWRGAMDQARMSWRAMQHRIIERWHAPIFQWKVAQWLAEDAQLAALASQSGVNPTKHTWNPPRWPYIEPVKDQTARAMDCASPVNSLRRVAGDHGNDFYDVTNERIADVAYAVKEAKKAAAAINKDFPDDDAPVTWRELWNPPVNTDIAVRAEVKADTGNSDQSTDTTSQQEASNDASN